MEKLKQTSILQMAKASNIESRAPETAKPRILPISAYSLDMCMQVCADMNAYNMTNTACGAAIFRADMADVTDRGGNCFFEDRL